MIVNKDTNPERDVYYIGAKVIEILDTFSKNQVDFFQVFHVLNESEGVSMNLYSLTLDWLYLVGAVKNAPNGSIEKCF